MEYTALFVIFGLIALIVICVTVCSVVNSSNERKRIMSRHKMASDVDIARYQYLTAMKLVDLSEVGAKDVSLDVLEVE
jgi:hypothetical protein